MSRLPRARARRACPRRPSVRTRVAFAAIVLAGVVGPLAARAEPASFRMPRVLQGDLESGLRLVVCPRANDGDVEILLAFAAGSDDLRAEDPAGAPEVLGRALALEWSSRFAKLPALAVDVRSECAGLRVRAARNGVRDVLAALVELVRDPRLGDDALGPAKDAAAQDAAARVKDPARHALALLHETAFPRRGRDAGPDAIRALGRDALRGWASAHLAPGNAVLVLVGGDDPGALFEAARDATASWPRGRIPAEPLLAAPRAEPRRLDTHGGARDAAAQVALGVPAPLPDDPDRLAIEVLHRALTLGPEAPLRAIAGVDVELGVLEGSERGLGLFAVVAQASDPDAALARIRGVLADAAREGLAPADFARGVRFSAASRRYALERPDLLARLLACDHLFQGDALAAERDVAGLEDLQEEDVRRAAARILDPARFAVVVVAPGTTAEG